MSDLAELVAAAVNPAMSRDEREEAYAVMRATVGYWQEQEGLTPADDRGALQRHLVEEAIRDVEIEIGRFLAVEAMRRIALAQEAEQAARNRRPPRGRRRDGVPDADIR